MFEFEVVTFMYVIIEQQKYHIIAGILLEQYT